jgi:hypothetical protein
MVKDRKQAIAIMLSEKGDSTHSDSSGGMGTKMKRVMK